MEQPSKQAVKKKVNLRMVVFMIMQYGVIKKIQEGKNLDLAKANRHSETTKEKQGLVKPARGRVCSRVYIKEAMLDF